MIAPTNQSTGKQRRDAVLNSLAARRAVFVNRGRRALLRRLLADGEATADDVRELVELPAGIDPTCFGSVPNGLAKAGIIERAGFRPTSRPDAHARPVSVWRLRDRAGALRWLSEHPDMADPAADSETKNARQLALPGIGV